MAQKNRLPNKVVKDGDYVDPKVYWRKMRAIGFETLGIENEGGNNRKAIKDANQLWELACCYFSKVDENPIIKNELIKTGDLAGRVIGIPVQRPYSWTGFSQFLCEYGILRDIRDYKENVQGQYEEYVPVIKKIGDIIYTQKFDHAAVGIFNANLIANDLKIAKHIETKDVSTNREIDYSQLSDEALEEIAKLQNNEEN